SDWSSDVCSSDLEYCSEVGPATRISPPMSALRLTIRRMPRVGWNWLAMTRTETHERQFSQAGRQAIDWLRRKPPWVRILLSSPAFSPTRWVKTFRSSRPARYGHGEGAVR